MKKTHFTLLAIIPIILSIGLSSSSPLSPVGMIEDAFALKAKGVSGTQYGDATKHIVCGDRLCSEVDDEEGKDNSSTSDAAKKIEEEDYNPPVINNDISELTDNIHGEHNNIISDLQAKIESLEAKITQYETEAKTVQANIERFDHLDFVSFNDQDWDVFSKLHHPDVLVGYSDGRETIGMDAHRPDVEFSFEYAPDIKITSHPITFGQGEWTAGTGVVEGTFTEPMHLPDGTVIEPTGNSFKYTMVTIAKWQDGVITEEYLFWDNAEVARQLGIAIQP